MPRRTRCVAGAAGPSPMAPDFLDISSFLRSLRAYDWWQVSIELLLIGLVVYWVMRFLRGTRGARMLKGIVSILIVLYLIIRLVANQFGLQRVAFLHGQFLQFASIAII